MVGADGTDITTGVLEVCEFFGACVGGTVFIDARHTFLHICYCSRTAATAKQSRVLV